MRILELVVSRGPVVVVDTNHDFAHRLQRSLSEEGYQAHAAVATDPSLLGIEAIDIAARLAPSYVILVGGDSATTELVRNSISPAQLLELSATERGGSITIFRKQGADFSQRPKEVTTRDG